MTSAINFDCSAATLAASLNNDLAAEGVTVSVTGGTPTTGNDRVYTVTFTSPAAPSQLLVPDASATLGDVDSQNRLRAFAGVDVSGISVFASFGAAAVGVGASEFRGASAGLGADIAISDRASIRIEAIRDNLEDSGSGDTWDNTTFWAGTVINF